MKLGQDPLEQPGGGRHWRVALAAAAALGLAGTVSFKGYTVFGSSSAASEDVTDERLLQYERRLQLSFAATTTTPAPEQCEQNKPWMNTPWVLLTYAEQRAWSTLGWAEQWWNLAWEANATQQSKSGRCFGGQYIIGETGTDECFFGELILSYEDCKNASSEYQIQFPGELFPLAKAVNELQGTPGCRTQDNSGFEFNEAQITGRNQGYTPICKFDATLTGGCPQTTTTTAPPLPQGLTYADTLPPAMLTCYDGLTRDEQDAVRLLGYDIASWHDCMRPGLNHPAWKPPTCSWPKGIPLPDAACLEQLDYIEATFNTSEPWRDLSYQAKRALVDLGWDSDGVAWGMAAKPDTYAKPWSGHPPPTGLSRKEREAADFLGYDQDSWHSCEMSTECISRVARVEAQLKPLYWRTMPKGIQAVLIVLGWNEDLWFEGELPAKYKLPWFDLRHPERVAARKLGYTKDMWEGCLMSQCNVRYDYVLAKYHEGLRWEDMKIAQQNAWTMLEHSEELWNGGGMMATRLISLRWAELSPEQQRQATFLGHDKGTWQGCNMEWGEGQNVSVYYPIGYGGPLRSVRVMMRIETAFSEISGNVYGQKVSTMPTSFIELFERSVARALFCHNPDYKNNTDGARDEDGGPLCKDPANFERQKRRIRVVSVLEGSILVDFLIIKNQTATEMSALDLFKKLYRQLESFASPISQDIEFGKFARVASIEEIPISHLSVEERERTMTFEGMRGGYNKGNACNLKRDIRTGEVKCDTGRAGGRASALLGLLMTMATMLGLAADI